MMFLKLAWLLPHIKESKTLAGLEPTAVTGQVIQKAMTYHPTTAAPHLILIKENDSQFLGKESHNSNTCFFYNLGVRWSSGNAFTCRSRGTWFKSYTAQPWISQGTRKESSRLHSTKVWIGTLRGLCLCKLDYPGCVCWLHTKPGVK